MGAPVLNGPFVMPMFRSFVPRKMQPWIYLFIAVTFQLSGGVYLGALNHMIGGMAVMREDILMCMYANLAGMAIYFPLLFRMKFRFTNKTLLTSAALGVLLCNLIAPHITFLPLLWLICFIEGMCKIQGTFECMSNIHVSLSLDLHEPVHRRTDADRSTDTNHLYQAFPVHAQVSAVRHRLAGRSTLGRLTCRNRFSL